MVTNNSANYAPTQYDILVGGSGGQIASVSPGSTSGYILTSNGVSSNPSFQVNGGLITIDGDTGSATPSSGVVTISAGNATNVCGAFVEFVGSGSTLSLQLSNQSNLAMALGSGAGNASLGGNSTCVGVGSGANCTGNNSTFVGYNAGNNVTSGAGNTFVGYEAGISGTTVVTGFNNTIMGAGAGPVSL